MTKGENYIVNIIGLEQLWYCISLICCVSKLLKPYILLRMFSYCVPFQQPFSALSVMANMS